MRPFSWGMLSRSSTPRGSLERGPTFRTPRRYSTASSRIPCACVAQQLSWLAGGALIFLAVASFDYRIISLIGCILYGFGIETPSYSGRFIGKGFLQGTQIRLRFLTALWTDFPFAVWAEKWGFIGCVAVLLAYGLLVPYFCYREAA